MIDNTNRQAAGAMESILSALNVPCLVDDIETNSFSIYYKLLPQGKTSVNKLKRIIIDLSIYFKNPEIIIDNGLYLKIDNVSGNRQFYDFFKYAEKTSGAELIPLYAGIDEHNNKIILDLSTLPHLLIAGATGTGKSIFIHDLILSLLTQDNNLLLILQINKNLTTKDMNVALTQPKDRLVTNKLAACWDIVRNAAKNTVNAINQYNNAEYLDPNTISLFMYS